LRSSLFNRPSHPSVAANRDDGAQQVQGGVYKATDLDDNRRSRYRFTGCKREWESRDIHRLARLASRTYGSSQQQLVVSVSFVDLHQQRQRGREQQCETERVIEEILRERKEQKGIRSR